MSTPAGYASQVYGITEAWPPGGSRTHNLGALTSPPLPFELLATEEHAPLSSDRRELKGAGVPAVENRLDALLVHQALKGKLRVPNHRARDNNGQGLQEA